MFEGRRQIRVRSLCVGGDIDTRSLRKARSLSTSPLTLEAGRCGCAIIFRYGAIVLFHVEPVDETSFLDGIRSLIQRPASEPLVEEIELSVSADGREGMEGNTLFVTDFSLPTLQVVAEVLARSVVLERFESRVRRSEGGEMGVGAAALGAGCNVNVDFAKCCGKNVTDDPF